MKKLGRFKVIESQATETPSQDESNNAATPLLGNNPSSITEVNMQIADEVLVPPRAFKSSPQMDL